MLKYMEAGVRELWLLDPICSRLLVYRSEDNGIPYIGPLEGSREIGIYGEKLKINLDEISLMIQQSREWQ